MVNVYPPTNFTVSIQTDHYPASADFPGLLIALAFNQLLDVGSIWNHVYHKYELILNYFAKITFLQLQIAKNITNITSPWRAVS